MSSFHFYSHRHSKPSYCLKILAGHIFHLQISEPKTQSSRKPRAFRECCHCISSHQIPALYSVTVIVSEVSSLPAVCASVLSLSPSPLSICVLWAANLVENGVVFPPVSCCQPGFMSHCVVLDFGFPPPLNLCRWSNCPGCSERIGREGLRMEGRWGSGGMGGIYHQCLALGLRTRGYRKTV